MTNFLVVKPKRPILSPDDLVEEAIEMLEPSEAHALLKQVIPDLGDLPLGAPDWYTEHHFGAAPLYVSLRDGSIGLTTYGQRAPEVRELLRQLLARGLVVFDLEIGELVTD